MCCSRSRLLSSTYGRLLSSPKSRHSAPKRRLISELCIFGLSSAIFFLFALDQTMKAFMGRLMCSPFDFVAIVILYLGRISFPAS
eukprot:m.75259 g.75259  ORF g.75259 m.75259 type:complete len:85 (+) comp35934_c0_seq2:912-1166(+)